MWNDLNTADYEGMIAQTVTLQSSHASPVSHPAEVAALIERAAR